MSEEWALFFLCCGLLGMVEGMVWMTLRDGRERAKAEREWRRRWGMEWSELAGSWMPVTRRPKPGPGRKQ